MDIPPDAMELRALWQKGRPILPLPEDLGGRVLEALEPESHWVARLNAARLSKLVKWSADDRELVINRLIALRNDSNRFVRPWALDAVWQLVSPDDPRRAIVDGWMANALAGSAAERARARLLLGRKPSPVERYSNG